MNSHTNEITNKIAEQETARFIDSQFGALDLSGCPSVVAPPPEEQFADCDSQGFNRVDTSGLSSTNRLKEFIQNPDRDAVQRIAKETANPELIEELEGERKEKEALAFKTAHPGYYPTDDNYEALTDYLEEHGLSFTRENLAKAFLALTARGELETKPGTLRNLIEPEKLFIARQAASGDTAGALANYIKGRLGEMAKEYENSDSFDDAEQFLSDPRFRDLCDEAAFHVWSIANHAYDRSQYRDFENVVNRASRTKPLSIPFLNALWAKYLEDTKKRERTTLLGQIGSEPSGIRVIDPKETITADLEEMTDTDIANLFDRTTKTRARQIVSGRRGAILA